MKEEEELLCDIATIIIVEDISIPYNKAKIMARLIIERFEDEQ